MIIFDLDGTFADCEHRRHFVQEPPVWQRNEGPIDALSFNVNCEKWRNWKPDWKSFYEACDKDTPIEPVIEILDGIYQNTINFWKDVEIWSGRCESVREKTIKWLRENILCDQLGSKITLKMRPIGDNTPDDMLKERWLDEALQQGKTIDFVFDHSQECCNMWRRRGIFVFHCNQTRKEF